MKKYFKEQQKAEPFEYLNFNTPLNCVLNKDTLQKLKQTNFSFCKAVRLNLAFVESTIYDLFDFSNGNILYQKNDGYCELDTCSITDPNLNCNFHVVYESYWSDEKQVNKCKPLSKRLVKSDEFAYSGNYYRYKLSLYFDITVTRRNKELVSFSTLSTKIQMKKRNERMRNKWDEIKHGQRIPAQIEQFKRDYETLLKPRVEIILSMTGFLNQ